MLVELRIESGVDIVHVDPKRIVLEITDPMAQGYYSDTVATIFTYKVPFRELDEKTPMACRNHKLLLVGKRGGIYVV